MMSFQVSSLPDYALALQAEGRIAFSRDEAIAALGVTEGSFLKAAKRLERRGLLLNPRRGFYVVVPPQHLSWGAPPPAWYIDPLIRHEDAPYYVGLLKAAELHGATHHAVMQFQVVTDRQLAAIRAGRSLISFHFRKDFAAVSGGVVERKTDTGSMKVSSPELTALDLVRYHRAAGGPDAVATVLADLGELIDGAKLAALAPRFERAVQQRLGYLLDRTGHGEKASELHSLLFADGEGVRWTGLEPPPRGAPSPEPEERDARWRVTVLRPLEIDA